MMTPPEDSWALLLAGDHQEVLLWVALWVALLGCHPLACDHHLQEWGARDLVDHHHQA